MKMYNIIITLNIIVFTCSASGGERVVVVMRVRVHVYVWGGGPPERNKDDDLDAARHFNLFAQMSF